MPKLRASERAQLRAQPYRANFMKLSSEKKKELIMQPWLSPMVALGIAAITMQKIVRGFQVRRLFPVRKYPPKKAPPAREPRPQMDKYLRAMRQNRDKADEGFSAWCATRVQAWWRMLEALRPFYLVRFSLYQIAALQVQGAWREFCQKKYMHMPSKVKETPEEQAAQMVQSRWRRYTNERIFRYYRDLIRFRLTGDPKMLLRTINPAETALFDRAAGVHVRFRLGGAAFPPTMFYKVYLHRPLCDIGAFAPRDYTTSRPRTPRQRHNKAETVEIARASGGATRVGSIRVGASYFGAELGDVGPDGTANWYRRTENNEWRPITMRVLADIEAPPPGMPKEEKPQPFNPQKLFHWCRATRQELGQQRRKDKKRKWLRRMYLEGMARDADQLEALAELRAEDAAERRNRDRGGRKKPEAKDATFMDVVSHAVEEARKEEARRARIPPPKEIDWDDEEEAMTAEELLKWSSELDYDGYISNWIQVATSGPSGGALPAKAVAPVSSADVQYTNSEFGSAPGTAESKFGSRGGSRGGFEAKSRDSLGAKSRGSMDTR